MLPLISATLGTPLVCKMYHMVLRNKTIATFNEINEELVVIYVLHLG